MPVRYCRIVALLRDWAEVVGALATAAAVIVAVLGLRRETRARKKAEARAEAAEAASTAERERSDRQRAEQEQAAQEERRKAQALQVIAWVETRRATRVLHDESGVRQLTDELVLHYVNQSPSPLFDARFAVHPSGYNEHTEILTIAVVPGHDRDEIVLSDELQWQQKKAFTGVVRFRDLQGAKWRRDENGNLQELHDYYQPM